MIYFYRTILLCCIMIQSLSFYAQSPDRFNYQAVVRDTTGVPLADSAVTVKISILKDSLQGSAVFEEEHAVITDLFGLFSLHIGTGANGFGLLDTLHWGDGTFYIKTEVDMNGSGSFIEISTTQLLSVPYALHANTADSLIGFDKNNKYDLPSGTIVKTSNPNDTNLLNNGFVLTNVVKDNSIPLVYTGNPNDSITNYTWSTLGSSNLDGAYIGPDHETHQFYFNGKFYLVYKCNGKVLEFNPATGNYVFSEPAFPSSFIGNWQGCYSRAVWTGSNLFLFENPSDTTSNPRLLKYTPTSNSWSFVSLPASLGDRILPEMRYANGLIVIIGGYDWNQANYSNFIEFYNPATNAWSSASTTNSPTARYNHTAVVAGDKLVVWGGADMNGNDLANGAVYDFVNDSWSSMASSSLSARQEVVSVWTGSKVIIYGGQTQTDGALYDPNSNSWSAMSTSNLPAGPTNSYAFDGEKLILTKHAGVTNYLYQETIYCSLYFPNSDAWQSLSLDIIPANHQGTTYRTHNGLVALSPAQTYGIGYVYENNTYKISLYEFNSLTINGVSEIGSSQSTWIYYYTKQ